MEPDKITGFSITKMKREASSSMANTHFHNYHELFYLAAGECSMFVDHDIYKLTAGSLIIIPEGKIHKSKYNDRGNSERYAISFLDDTLQELNNFAGVAQIDNWFKTVTIKIPEKRRDYFEKLMNKLIFESGGVDELSPAFSSLFFRELMLFIIRCEKYEENVVREIDVDNSVIQEIATYIYNNYEKNIYLEDVAIKYNMSRSYLSKKFKATTGFGFKEYLVNVRIKEACRLLLESDQNITEIALSCGFNDSNYFGDAFRRIKGMSPLKYRKNKETI